MDMKAVAECLSRATVDVADEEYRCLSRGLTDIQVAQKLNGALGSLDKLSQGIMPQYSDEWVALLYMTWYHPNHVNLAYSMIGSALAERERSLGNNPCNPTLTNTGRLHVVDFGCGTMAMQFGVALAVADALDGEQEIYSVKVDSIDASQEMSGLGQKLWDSFTVFVAQDGRLDSLARVLDRMDAKVGEFTPSTNDHEYWLSAMHVTYDDNVNNVEESLRNLCDQVRPSLGFMTSHNNPWGKTLADMASPFKDNQYYSEIPCRIDPVFSGGLTAVTQWRYTVKRDICQKLTAATQQLKFLGGDKGYYMGNPVNWRWQDAKCRIYTRNE